MTAGTGRLWPLLAPAEVSVKAVTDLLDDGRVLREPGRPRAASALACAPLHGPHPRV